MTDRLRFSDSREQPTPPRPPVAIKGRADGLRITVQGQSHGQAHDPLPAAAIEASLRQQLDQRGDAFFAGAAVTLELPPGPLDLALAARLGEILRAAGMRLEMVVAGDAAARPKSVPAAERGGGEAAMPADGTLVVHRTLRSGQRVAAAGTVVVLGDVNAGAEVLAGGSVIVWGRLRGIVEAGLDDAASDRQPAVVCALDLAPTQLRIGPAIARAPEDPGRVPVPEVARVQDGRIVVEVWR